MQQMHFLVCAGTTLSHAMHPIYAAHGAEASIYLCWTVQGLACMLPPRNPDPGCHLLCNTYLEGMTILRTCNSVGPSA